MQVLAEVAGSDVVMSVALVAVPLIVGRAFAWWKAECRRGGEEARARAVEALEVGVNEAWEAYGRQWKAARADGKLSDEARAGLRKFASETAIEVGRARGVDVLKTLGEQAIGSLIRGIVDRRKRGPGPAA